MLRECRVHKHRRTVPIDAHHILPKAHGGSDDPWNLLDVCPNGHRRIHDYIRLLGKHNGKAPWLKRKFFGHKVRFYGAMGYGLMTEGDIHVGW